MFSVQLVFRFAQSWFPLLPLFASSALSLFSLVFNPILYYKTCMLVASYSPPPPSNLLLDHHHNSPPRTAPPSSSDPPTSSSSSATHQRNNNNFIPSSTPAPSSVTHSGPPPQLANVNPLYNLGQRVETGSLDSVHILSGKPGNALVRQGTPPTLIHPSTWPQLLPSSRPSSSARKQQTIMTPPSPSIQDAAAAAAASEQQQQHDEEVTRKLNETQDSDLQSSLGDKARMRLQQLKTTVRHPGTKEAGDQAAPNDLDPRVTRQLERPAAELDQDNTPMSSPSSPPPSRMSNGVSNSSFYSATSGTSDGDLPPPRRTSSPLPLDPSSALPRSESPISYMSPPLPTSNGDRTPILHAPGLAVTNSRTVLGSAPALAPLLSSSPDSSSSTTLMGSNPNNTTPAPRRVSASSLHRPLQPQASTSSFLSASPSPMRRSNTTGTALGPSLSRQSNASNSSPTTNRLPSPKPQRAFSYQPSPTSPSGDGSRPLYAAPPPHEYDEVESSIAAQAEVIRKQRQEKRLEKEKERVEQEAAAAGNRQSGGLVGGAPMMKRRSTKMGVGGVGGGVNGAGGAEQGGPGAGVLVGNLIGQDHANYVLMYNMLTGIRIGVSPFRRDGSLALG